MKFSKNKKDNILQLLFGLIILISVNVIAVYYFHRFDMTEEKRFSLSQSTHDILTNLDDNLSIKVYLDGDLPVKYKQLRNSTRELLDEFRAYNTDIQYEFINPSAEEDKRKRFKYYQQLANEGVPYYMVPEENKDGYAQKTIFTGATITYKEKTQVINLVISSRKVPDEIDLNNSIQRLELTIMSALRKLSQKKPITIAFAEGHGELDEFELGDLSYDLSQTYEVGLLNVGADLSSLSYRVKVDSLKSKVINKFDLLVIAKPDSIFDDKTKFLIDQFIMHGGKVVWVVDAVDASMDSLRNSSTTFGLRKDIGLFEMFYKYGVRINPELVLNRNAMEIGTVEGALKPWDFFPLALPVNGSPITANLNSVKTQFVSSLDIVGSDNLKKTVLLKTDERCRIMPTPAIIDVADIIYQRPNRAMYNAPAQNIAVLVEGVFESYFTNKIIDPRIENDPDFDILYKSPETSQLFVSCGDMIRNDVVSGGNGVIPMPLGFDRFSGRMYDNKKFFMNSINYMLDDEELISLRNKDFKIRLLNKDQISMSRLKYQLINTVLPVFLIVLFGVFMFIYKRRRFAIR